MQAASINGTNFRHVMYKKNKYTKYKRKSIIQGCYSGSSAKHVCPCGEKWNWNFIH